MIISQGIAALLGIKKIEQLQQMLNLGDEQTSLTPSISNTQDNFNRTGSEKNLRTGHLNL